MTSRQVRQTCSPNFNPSRGATAATRTFTLLIMSTEIVPHAIQQNNSAFSSITNFESAQRMAMALCSSDLVPETYRGKDKIGNALIALEMSQRIGASPLAVMQNLNIIHGRPAWSSSFIIAALNTCGRFSPLRFRVEGTGESQICIAWAYDKSGGEILEGPQASIAMAKAEGWYQKNGSKWKTMPDLMLRYRAAAFFGRLYAPDVLNGMHTADEVEDFRGGGANASVGAVPSVVAALNARVQSPPMASPLIPNPAPSPLIIEVPVESAQEEPPAASPSPKPSPKRPRTPASGAEEVAPGEPVSEPEPVAVAVHQNDWV
jgi:hypothetical protein